VVLGAFRPFRARLAPVWPRVELAPGRELAPVWPRVELAPGRELAPVWPRVELAPGRELAPVWPRVELAPYPGQWGRWRGPDIRTPPPVKARAWAPISGAVGAWAGAERTNAPAS
jgi:hypothetical protein